MKSHTSNSAKRNRIERFFYSFVYATRGIHHAMAGRNMKLHVLATALVIIWGFLLHVSRIEWAILVICIGAVLSAEVMNSAIEVICDRLLDHGSVPYEKLGTPKDLAAGAVLIVALASAIVAALIFIPHVLQLFT